MTDLDRRELLQRAGLGAAALTASAQLDVASAFAEAEASHHTGNKALRQLKRMVRGRVFTPGDDGYHHVRRVYNKRFNHLHPEAVVRVRDVADVRAVMKWANRFDVKVRARSGGHSYAGYSTTKDGVVVDLSRLQRIHVRDGNRRVAIGAGAGLMQMYSKLAKKGLTVPGGSCPTVGITGLALGGGMGFASRKYGLTCDNLTSVSIVTPDGKFLKVDERNQPGLFWACQGGGGGNFGIVTSLEFKTHRVKQASYYFASWPWSQASAALEAWQHLTEEAPPELCPFFSFLTGGSSPKAHSEGQFFGSERELHKALKRLRDVDGIELTIGSKSYGDLMKHWAGCDEESVKSCEKPDRTTFFAASDYVHKALSSSGRAAMIRAIEQHPGEGGSGAILLDGYGGEINKVRSRATAFVHRDQLYCIQYYSQAANKGQRKGASRWVKDARRHMSNHVSGQAYQNYIDPRLKGWKQAYYGKNYERLVDVKTRYDPDNRLRFPQGIRPRR